MPFPTNFVEVRPGHAAATAILMLLAADANPSRADDLYLVRSQVWHQDSAGVQDDAEAGDSFGETLAVGDFNRDGYDDLAIGVPNESSKAVGSYGAVAVLFGGPDGLSAVGNQLLDQTDSAIPETLEADDQFGSALAVVEEALGDGLAVGVPQEDLGATYTGLVHRFDSGISGLGGDFYFNQDTGGILGSSESFDFFGYALAVGDFNHSGAKSDLAIGVPGDRPVVEGSDTGGVNVIYDEYSETDDLILPGDWTGDGDYYQDWFGAALAVGNFNCDDYDDLAIGSPRADINKVSNAGSVNILFGSSTGLGAGEDGDEEWDQGSGGVSGTVEEDDQFGTTLTSGDFDGNGCDDLAIGIPLEDVGVENADAGAVTVLYGVLFGLGSSGNELFYRGNGLAGAAAAGDQVGAALAAADLDADGHDDLLIGAPNEEVPDSKESPVDSGALHIIYGTEDGLMPVLRERVIHVGAAAAGDEPGSGDEYGGAIAVGDFDNDGHEDVAVGAPGRLVSFQAGAGAVFVYYGALFAANFEQGDLEEWSSWVN